MTELPWCERVPALSIHPDMATRHDVARLAAEVMDLRQFCAKFVADVDSHDAPLSDAWWFADGETMYERAKDLTVLYRTGG